MRVSATALAAAGRNVNEPGAAALARDIRRYAAVHAQDRGPHVETPWARALDGHLHALETSQRAARGSERDHASDLTRAAWIAGASGVAATLLCAVGMLLYLRRALLAPLRGVAGAAQRLAAGDLRARVGRRDGIGEVGELARTFDQMADSLEESRAALERQNRELAEQRSELIEAVRSAREGASIVRAVLDTTPDAIALLDGDGGVIVDNPPMRRVRAAFAAHATTLDPRVALHADGDGELRDEVVLPGGRRTFARYVAPVHDGRGRLIGRLIVVRDITAEREAERAKQDFFALVSHELRTPLTAILGYVELLLSDDVSAFPPEHARHLEVIERNARRLVRLVGDLLFAAQVEGAPLLLEPASRPRRARARRRRARPLPRRGGWHRARDRARAGRTLRRRPRPPRAGARQPAVERAQVHATRRACRGAARGRGIACAHRGRRLRRRHPRGGPAAPVRPLLSRAQRDRPLDPRARARADDRAHDRRGPRRHRVGQQRPWRRGDVHPAAGGPAVGSGSRSREPSRADHRQTAPSPASGAGSPRRA